LDNDLIMKIIVGVVPIIIAITFHEVAHGYVAYRLGDPTAKLLGRLTLDPLKHIDPVGTILVPLVLYAVGGIPFGWAKPVPIGVRNFKNPRRDMGLTGVAGPLTNLALAIVSAILLRFVLVPLGSVIPEGVFLGFLKLLYASVQINIILAAFNLIPVPPLDGSRVLAALVPRHIANRIDELERYGIIIVMILIFTGIFRYILGPLFTLFYTILINPILGPITGG